MTNEIADERDHFQAAMHRMRDAFVQLKDRYEVTREFGSAAEQNGDFFDGYQQAKAMFGTVLLERDVGVRHTRREYRLANALKWIRMVAGLHYFGEAFEPEHMRALGNIAADALDDRNARNVKDYDQAMSEAKAEASKMAGEMGLELAGDD